MSSSTTLPTDQRRATPPGACWPRGLTGLVCAVLCIGLAWRISRYLLHFPIWGDEAHLCLNIVDRDFAGLMHPLRFLQAAPLLFLWGERAMYELWGSSELALRLPALLGGLGAVLLFWRLAKATLPPLPAALAVGILAVSYYPVRHSCEAKPYGIDLFMSVALLGLGVGWLQQPQRLFWPVLLTLLVPFALGISYPAVFIAATISIVLLPVLWRQSDGKIRLLYLLYNIVLLASFWLFFSVTAAAQFESDRGNWTEMYSDCFPPLAPLEFLRWFVVIHTGNLLAYPLGGHTGGSTLTALLCLVGIWQLVRSRQWQLLGICLVPFGLTMLAAALHRYPYGGSARYEQHLAPLICILAATGGAALLVGAASQLITAQRGAFVALVLLGAAGLAGMARDFAKPYKTEGDSQVRQILADIVCHAGPSDQIVVMDPASCMGSTIEWYLRQQGSRISWGGQIDWPRLGVGAGRLWSLYFSVDRARFATLPAQIERKTGNKVVLVEHQEHWLQLGWSWDEKTKRYCDVYLWKGQ